MRILTAHQAAFRSIVSAPDSGTLYGFGWGRAGDGLHVWDLGAETGRAELRHVGRRVWGCWPLPDGRLLLGCGVAAYRGVVNVVTPDGGWHRLPLDLLLNSVSISLSPLADRFAPTDRSVYDADIKCRRRAAEGGGVGLEVSRLVPNGGGVLL